MRSMTKKDGTPQIRFKGFTDAWEQRKVNNLFRITRGHVLAANKIQATKTSVKLYPVYSSQTKDKGLMGYYSEYIYENAITWTTDGANAGTVNYRPGKFYCTNVCGVLLSDTIKANQMLAEALNKVSKNYVSYVGNPKLMNNVMADIAILIPVQEEEREKLSEFFHRLDHLITLHQRKYDKLLNVKKSMLEKMFPKNGSDVPEIRFKGFTDAWEQRKLGECFRERSESMPNGELISVTINSGIKKFSELGRHDNSNDDKSKYKKVCIGDIAYNSMRMWQGASGYSHYEGIVSPAYTVLKPNVGINSKCLAYQFKLPEMLHTFQTNSQGITSDNWNLKYQILSKIEIAVSKNEEEQAKIARLFSSLDHLITLHQRKLEKLQNIKKSMLEKMFV